MIIQVELEWLDDMRTLLGSLARDLAAGQNLSQFKQGLRMIQDHILEKIGSKGRSARLKSRKKSTLEKEGFFETCVCY